MSENMRGILAYGSLLVDPGDEIARVTTELLPVTTPFPIEYARSSRGRAGAPTLVPVPEGYGAPVQAKILLVQPEIQETLLINMLYRREVNRIGEFGVEYNEEVQEQERDPVLIKSIDGLGNVTKVFYTWLRPNIELVLDTSSTRGDKAQYLSKLAADSVTAETYAEGRDGILYLADALEHGIRTPLTAPYHAAVLRRADDAADLETARARIARKKNLALGDHV